MIEEKSHIKQHQSSERLKARHLDAERSLMKMELERVDFTLAIKSLLKAVIRLSRSADGGDWLNQLEAFVDKSKFSLDETETLVGALAKMGSPAGLIDTSEPPKAASEEAPSETPDSVAGEPDHKAQAQLKEAEKLKNTQLILQIKNLLTQISARRGYRFNDEAEAIAKKLDETQEFDVILSDITFLMSRFVQDYSEEKAQITSRLSNIIKVLINTEDEFKRLIRQSIAYMDEDNREFNESLVERVTQIHDSVHEAQDDALSDAEKLLTLIAVKVEDLCQSIQEKTLQDEKRLMELQKENTALESRLDSVRRDYDTFVTQSHKLLKELEDFKSISMRDALTGVYNRRAYDEAVNLSIENFKYNRLETFSLLIFDIDHFRDVNNTYGHQAGDNILSHMGRIVAELLRCDDFIFRYGGDEFICLLPQAKLSDASRVAEKIRQAVERVEFKLSRHSEKTIHISISMGVTEIRPGDNAISVLARADTALYVSKQNGRNRVTSD
ncbi:MAG: diguanylate cyclase [Deltaproteobacteria bacterium]|jgi:diguanylate cyclase (GGDEF)-like protein|nr:diguanylate cyclase [Deltaproteobacteria bacterium]